ncbi:MAG: pyridoxamine kinase [Oscillospiraceae bacterium]|nr:pyridoxamine kinase [Oscillospiraceae bacterium]
MEDLIRLAAIHDISGVGKCSLTVALPVISATGVECACLPTALLSTHTGGFEDFTFRDLSEDMLPIARHWKREGIRFDGIYSGYLASSKQEETLEELIGLISNENTKIIVDPVMADNGNYYSNLGHDMCLAFRRLCGRADIVTPNVTEAALLTGLSYKEGPHTREYIDSLIQGLAALCGGIIAVTGVCPDEVSVGVYAVDTRTGEKCFAPGEAKAGVFCGTGDLFASAFSALMLRGAGLKDSVETAVSFVNESIERTVARGTPRRNGVDFEGALPNYITRVSELFRK